MRTIRRYELPWSGTADAITLALPRGAQVFRFAMLLSGAIQAPQYHPTIWAEVDTEKPAEQRRFLLVRTDDALHEAAAYLGSYDEWHLLEPAVIPIPAHLAAMLPDFPAVNAYRLLIREGFTLRGDFAWDGPGDEPLTAEQVEAVGELQEHGFGSVV